MQEQVVTLRFPKPLFDRIQITAQANSLTSEEIIKQSVILLLPAFESDIPTSQQLDLSKLLFLNDMQLWKVANMEMASSQQSRLEKLAEEKKHNPLDENESFEIDILMNEAQRILLCKAEAKRILSQRGHMIFGSIEN
ncbi:MAG: hypothetical protein HQK75_17985 [Candidatus Magnetomorum sp.]|nr:hypothetical protein [Candidatus Magnetomorum sp.]